MMPFVLGPFTDILPLYGCMAVAHNVLASSSGLLLLAGYEQWKSFFEGMLATRRSSSLSTHSHTSTGTASLTGASPTPPWVFYASGALSGAIASLLTNPLDLAKLRIQVTS